MRFIEKIDWGITTIVVVTAIGLSHPALRYETKNLEDNSQIKLEKCSPLIDGYKIWKKYNSKGLEEINSLFKDKKKNFYICRNDYCKELP